MVASILLPRISRVDGPRADGSYEFTITYQANFSADEVGRFFDDAVKIWESDSFDGPPSPTDPDGDDTVSTYTPVETFRVTAESMARTKRITLTGDQVSTEIGAEEFYGWVWLRRSGSTGPAADEQHTPAGIESVTVDD